MKYNDIFPTMADVYAGEAKALFTVVSTFAGCGGSSTGYRLAGGKILAVNEFIEKAVETYKANYPTTPVIAKDIRKVTAGEIFELTGIKKGELDILDGSPPCCSFSMAGSREEGWGKVRKYSDTKQRTDDLFFEFTRLLKEIQPRCFICENVEGLTLGGANSILGSTQDNLFADRPRTIIDEFIDCGYNVAYSVLNSAKFGVPQTRRRLIILGVRKDIGKRPTFPERKVSSYITLREGVEGLENDPKELEEARIKEKYEIYKYIIQMKEGECGSKYNPKGSYFSLSRLEWDKPVSTIQQSHGAPGIACNTIHPTENRKLTIKELRRVSSFPDDFKLIGTFEQQWERIGRAVPPLMMKAIAEHIYSTILKDLPGRER